VSISSNKGFTLVELLVVFALLALVSGLIGPTAINQVEKTQSKSELMSLNNWIDQIAVRAFHSGTSLMLEVGGNEARLKINSQQPQVLEHVAFQHLQFPNQQVIFSDKGFSDVPFLKVRIRGRQQDVVLSDSRIERI
jgi:prepilin-type N-terminal cleavage/methylation domain-containing protein